MFLLSPEPENDYLGFDPAVLAKHLSPAILIADILVEIDYVLRAVGAAGQHRAIPTGVATIHDRAKTLDEFHSELPAFVEHLAALPRTQDPMTCPRVVVTGDFFTRFSPFFMDGVRDLYAARGIILKPVDLSDLFLYVAYDGLTQTANDWGMKPGGLALAKACTRVFEHRRTTVFAAMVDIISPDEEPRNIIADSSPRPGCLSPDPTMLLPCLRKVRNTFLPRSSAKSLPRWARAWMRNRKATTASS